MSGTLPPVYALVTALTALLVTTVLVPVLRLMLEPGVVLPRRAPVHTPAAAGSLSVLLAAAVLLPMGGDGLLVPFTDAPIAFGLFSALLLFALGSTRVYNTSPVYVRVGLQAAVAFLAALGGVHAQAASFPTHASTVVVLLVGMNAMQAMRRTRGLAVSAAAVVAGFLACLAPAFTEHGLSDLNLGLSGALLALFVFHVTPQIRLRVQLGSGGRLAIGFLIGMSYLRLMPQAVPEARAWIVLPMLLPLLALAVAVLKPAVLRIPSRYVPYRAALAAWVRERIAWLRLNAAHVLILVFLVNVTVALGTLRVLGLL